MKTIQNIKHVIIFMTIATILMWTSSCKKENLKDPAAANESVSFSDANKKIFNPFAFSPWHIRSSGESIPDRVIGEMSEPNQFTSYGLVYDNLGLTVLHDIDITHNGGASWHSQTIAGLEDDVPFGVAATTARTVHVMGYNYVKGGGDVFRSTDGGTTWEREGDNAFTDPASFPDVIQFFDPLHGVMFGDPQGGYFEIYTTSDGGNSWSRVPSNKIPAPLANEFGISTHSDIYLNTIWMMVSTVDENFNPISSRLLQSDDKGMNWYLKNPLVPANGYDASLKFRNRSVGLYKNNGILYRTTDGGTSWNVVNYSGHWFSFDLDNIPGLPGWWISTGGGTPGNPLSLYGFGSSVSYDDGNHWITLDTLNHTCVDMTSPFHGYSGGVTSAGGNDGVFVYSLLPSRLSSLREAGNDPINNVKEAKVLLRPSGNILMPGDKSAFLRNLKRR